MGRLGFDPSAPLVVSRRNSQEKPPWREAPGVENRVEAEFLRPVLLGESIVPYKVFQPFEGVVPVHSGADVLNAEAVANRGIEGLHGWMRKSEAIWNAHTVSGAMSLVERWNYHNELGAQFPIAPIRVVYAKAGTLPAACVVTDQRTVIDHMLYWMAAETRVEADYLAAILNSETARLRIESFQARGQFGARHFDKVVFNLPIPRFDPAADLHAALADAALRAERIAAAVVFPEGVKFQRARRLVRDALTNAGIAADIDGLVARLLDGA